MDQAVRTAVRQRMPFCKQVCVLTLMQALLRLVRAPVPSATAPLSRAACPCTAAGAWGCQVCFGVSLHAEDSVHMACRAVKSLASVQWARTSSLRMLFLYAQDDGAELAARMYRFQATRRLPAPQCKTEPGVAHERGMSARAFAHDYPSLIPCIAARMGAFGRALASSQTGARRAIADGWAPQTPSSAMMRGTHINSSAAA